MTFSNRRLRALAIALRVALGAVFVYAAWAKIRAPWQLFAGAIADYKVLPDAAVIPLARVLPWSELAIGILLIAGLLLRPAAVGATLMLAGFFILMVRAYLLHMDISCGCFGPTGDPISWRTLLRDGALLAASLAVTWMAFSHRSRVEHPEPSVPAERTNS